MIMEILEKLPEHNAVIGTKEVIRAAKAGKVKLIVVASNCPDFLIEKATGSQLGSVKIKKFTGDQADLGTRLGKPFPVAMVGY